MPTLKLGVTATELFTYNPFRILGTAVDTPAEKITELYEKLISMSEGGTISQYKTEYDFEGSLPPFERKVGDLKTAYAKIASNGYRCFAYSGKEFSAALNVDDIMLNLRDITCYDCFLRCYMWLITNDREFEEPELWILLCKHIDEMIMSTPDQWSTLFDHRFPENMPGDKVSTLRTLYATFCDIILLPIKEMVRGSMKCSTATEILKIAGVDVDEKFEYVEIPQANLPKAGEPAPLLKIAVKDGEEYFDVAQGHMVSFKTDTEAVESNSFDTTTSTISAAAIIGDKAPAAADDYIPPEPEYTAPAPAEADELEKVKPIEPKLLHPAAGLRPAAGVTAHKVQEEEAVQTQAQPEAQQPLRPAVTPAPVHKPVAPPPSQIKQAIPETDDDGDMVIPTRRSRVKIPPKGAEPAASQSLTQADNTPIYRPSAQPKAKLPIDGTAGTAVAKGAFKKGNKSLADLVDEVDDEELNLDDEDEEEENIYTNVLIKMLRSNRSETMKGVDTSHVYDNGDSLGIAGGEPKLAMDAINEKRMDKSLLFTSYEPDPDETNPRKLMEEKYKGINIDDMLNPISPNKFAQQFQRDAVLEYKSNKQKEKQTNKAILKFVGIVFLLIVVFLLLYLFNVI